MRPSALKWLTAWVSALALLPAVVVASRTQDALPPARDIIARHVAAIGGEAAYKALRSLRATGTFKIPVQGIKATLELLSARPNKLLYRVMVPGIGLIENGYDGTIGWTRSPVTGPELLSGRQLSEAADEAWFDAPLHPAERLAELTTMAKVEFDGHPAFKVRTVSTAGNEQMEYFDVASGFQIGAEASRATPAGVVPTVNVLRDYKKFGAVMQPTTFIQRALGFEQVVTILTCEYDTVPDTAFAPPAEVRALVPR